MNKLLILILVTLNSANSHDNSQSSLNGDDSAKTIAEYVISYGYNFEEHKVPTSDGYILTMWRIPKRISEKRRRSQPVLLQHGVLDTSMSWLFKSPGHNLATILVDEGYDVWLGNNRGSIISNEHSSPQTHSWRGFQSPFWDFSFDHMGAQDFPAMLDYVRDSTGFDKVVYVGHSQGAIQFFIKTILDPEFVNARVKAFVGLAPVLFLHNMPGAMERYMERSHLIDLLYYLRIKNFGALPWMSPLCVYITKLFPNLARRIITAITGETRNQTFDLARLPVIASSEMGGTSIQNMLHWVQLMRQDRGFRMFDYGAEENMERYGQEAPPEYDVSHLANLTCPIHLVAGESDNVISKKDFEALIALLPRQTTYEYVEDYGHLDYLWADDAHVKIYQRMVKFLKKVCKDQLRDYYDL